MYAGESMKITIFTRIRDLVQKMISVKGLVFAVATTLQILGKLDSWIWFLIALSVISIRMFEKKILGSIQEGRENNTQGITG